MFERIRSHELPKHITNEAGVKLALFVNQESEFTYRNKEAIDLRSSIERRNNENAYKQFLIEKEYCSFTSLPTKQLLIRKRDSGEITYAEYEKIYKKVFAGDKLNKDDFNESREKRYAEAMKASTPEKQFWIAMIAELAPNNTKSVDELTAHYEQPSPPKARKPAKASKAVSEDMKITGFSISPRGKRFIVLGVIKLGDAKTTKSYGTYDSREAAERVADGLRAEHNLPKPKKRPSRLAKRP
ncbi:hypothetical protein [Klebsiella variicola]|uniref:hypothetical protein n=1 Tax=Klebsiella variicola TaxID=244366 RepID=UPI0034DEB495